jgi:hypothetical protein
LACECGDDGSGVFYDSTHNPSLNLASDSAACTRNLKSPVEAVTGLGFRCECIKSGVSLYLAVSTSGSLAWSGSLRLNPIADESGGSFAKREAVSLLRRILAHRPIIFWQYTSPTNAEDMSFFGHEVHNCISERM